MQVTQSARGFENGITETQSDHARVGQIRKSTEADRALAVSPEGGKASHRKSSKMSLSQVGVYYGVLECYEGCLKGVRWSLEEFERCLEGREGVVKLREGV